MGGHSRAVDLERTVRRIPADARKTATELAQPNPIPLVFHSASWVVNDAAFAYPKKCAHSYIKVAGPAMGIIRQSLSGLETYVLSI